LEEDTAYELKVVVKEKFETTLFENPQTVTFKTCKRTSEILQNNYSFALLNRLFSLAASSAPVRISGYSLCIPWEDISNECPVRTCKVNNKSAALSISTGAKCCSIKNTPSKSTNYVINVYGLQDELRAQVTYTSPRSDEIS
jgi:hypothetical protein